MSQPQLPLDDITGIVLAGGRSSRFGADKLNAELEGRPLLHRALAAAAAVAGPLIVVSAPDVEPRIPADLAARVRVVHDPEPYGGPLVGLVAALSIVGTPVTLVVGGDMPHMVPAVLVRLAIAVGPAHRAVMLEVSGRFQPLPMALDAAAALAAGTLILEGGGRRLGDLLRQLGASAIPSPVWLTLDPAGATIVDIDRPADLERLTPDWRNRARRRPRSE